MENKTNMENEANMGLSLQQGGVVSKNTISQYASMLGKRGGDKNVANHDHQHFVNLGKQGMEKRWAGHKKTI